jgi:hypothetical protein
MALIFFDFNDDFGSPAGCLDGSYDGTYAGFMSLSTDNVNIIPQNTFDSSGIGTGGLYNFVEVTNNTIFNIV